MSEHISVFDLSPKKNNCKGLLLSAARDFAALKIALLVSPAAQKFKSLKSLLPIYLGILSKAQGHTLCN